MANVVSSTPYSFTSAMAATFHNTVGSTPASGAINVQSVIWASPAHVGDAITITDGKGHTLLHIVANATDVANGQVSSVLAQANSSVADFQVTEISSGTLYIETLQTSSQTGAGTVTTKGTAVAAGTAQAQNAVTLSGATATSAIAWALAAAPAASWQTGIQVVPVVANDTVTIYLVNPTAGSITPVAATINIRVIN